MPPEPRILLDECVPPRLSHAFSAGVLVHSAKCAGFLSPRNGRLLAAAQGRYDVIVTVDQGMASEQNLQRWGIALITVSAKSEAEAVLAFFVPLIVRRTESASPGDSVLLTIDEVELNPLG